MNFFSDEINEILFPSFTSTICIIALFILNGCQLSTHHDIPEITQQRAENLDQAFSELLDEHNLTTAGVAVIKDGEIVWEGYFGEEKPGKPASETTLFNVASITKTVSAETFLRLVEQGKLSLDTSMEDYWVDPDLENDPRHKDLTPRMALTHTTGFRNWRFFSEDNTLRFMEDPGVSYSYSGEGFEYIARYAEEKLGSGFDELVKKEVLNPEGLTGISFSVQQENFENMAMAVDEEGNFYGHYCRPNGWCREEGAYSAADEMVTNVKDYGRFLISVMNGEGYSKKLEAERNRVQTPVGVIDCDTVSPEQCPDAQGYGLGWQVLDYGDNKLISHGGSDWAEFALAYFYTKSRDGLIIFFNAPTRMALPAMPKAIEYIDPGSPMADHYRMRAGISDQ